jgi:2',3'-cyclic-nucleotide 2'-phosphodiesterase/3'-nucleotidase
MQTFGQATHLGYLRLEIDGKSGKIVAHDGKLIPVDSARLAPDHEVTAKLDRYRSLYPQLREKVGRTEARMNRRYIEESDVGNLFADILRSVSGAEVSFIHSGSLRKDLPEGDVARVDILDTYPFVDDIVVLRMTGDQIRRVLEQSLTLERGLLQVSGIEIVYDLSKPEKRRLVSMKREGSPIEADEQIDVVVSGFLAEGGDLYDAFAEAARLRTLGKVSDVVIDYFKTGGVVKVPPRGRQKSAPSGR